MVDILNTITHHTTTDKHINAPHKSQVYQRTTQIATTLAHRTNRNHTIVSHKS